MFARLLRPRTIERRLLLWLLIIALVPSLTVLAAASWIGAEATRFVGASGSWLGVAESGRELIRQAEASPDPQLRKAARAHREQLSTSLTQASRFEFLGQRLRASLPLFFLALALIVAAIASWAARRMARSVSRPIRELVDWSSMLAREEALPPVSPRETRELRELQTLRGALRRASAEISAARIRALEAERTKSWGEMARRVAHEMKNPLTPLRLASYRLNRIASEQVELAEPIAVIADETARLEELAARFAMLGRPAEGPRAPVDVAELLQRLLATDVPAAVDATIMVRAENPFVLADYNALIQVFRNLVRNALEAMDSTRRVATLRVSVTDDREHTDWLRVIVADNGRGLGDGPWDRLFEPDFTSKAGGTGLGLAVARQTIRAHGGDISARRGADGGAEFVVRLPRLAQESISERG
jgi:nitrogen fixation/metabolism regulation signal transduction histidine kinase